MINCPEQVIQEVSLAIWDHSVATRDKCHNPTQTVRPVLNLPTPWRLS